MKRLVLISASLIGSATTAFAHPGPHNGTSAGATALHFVTDPYHIATLIVGVAIGFGVAQLFGHEFECTN
jgi:hydrogenase/urease accessory protein HupE